MHEENGQQEKKSSATLKELHEALYETRRRSYSDEYDDDDADCYFD